jgi:hypothetical protein
MLICMRNNIELSITWDTWSLPKICANNSPFCIQNRDDKRSLGRCRGIIYEYMPHFDQVEEVLNSE